ncbi:hypothetical protein [Kosakonia radicincitans]|uniref:hypothetical protein n=1 Tax=Kosakonia radicincitans TaxID=283686 RepID=UPI0005C2C0E4|nr:hypothetical protein [Kosakonia radicincitans]KIS43110.1 hypothetical protein LG58_1993 [Kosakonia radicincitans YD4]
MNNKKTILFSFIFLIAGAIVGYLYYLFVASSGYTETCSASVIVYHKNVQANFTLDFMYNREAKRGVVSVSGGYMEDNKPTETIRRDVSYTWTENRRSYHFTSTAVNKVDSIETSTDNVIASVLPDFYVYPNKEINYSIRPQGKNGFLFVIGKRPLFLCAR